MITPIKERQIIHRWYYSEINEEFYKINEGYITRYFAQEEKYQTYSPNFDSKETCNSIPEDATPIAKRERMKFKIEKQFSYRKTIIDTPNFNKYIKSLPKWKQLLISDYTESKKMDPLITYIQSKKKLVIASDGSKSNTTSGGAWTVSYTHLTLPTSAIV